MTRRGWHSCVRPHGRVRRGGPFEGGGLLGFVCSACLLVLVRLTGQGEMGEVRSHGTSAAHRAVSASLSNNNITSALHPVSPIPQASAMLVLARSRVGCDLRPALVQSTRVDRPVRAIGEVLSFSESRLSPFSTKSPPQVSCCLLMNEACEIHRS